MNHIDEKGFVNEEYYLILFFPVLRRYLAFKVLERLNRGFENLLYGPLPYQETDHGEGVVPAGKFAGPYVFPSYFKAARDRIQWEGLVAEAANDIFYFEEKDKIFDVFLHIKPFLLRNYIQYPRNVSQISFREKVIARHDKIDDFGFFRNTYNAIYLPKIDIGYISANNTNVNLRTFVSFDYAEYRVELIKKKEDFLTILRDREKYKLVTMPYFSSQTKVQNVFEKIYEIEPFTAEEEKKEEKK